MPLTLPPLNALRAFEAAARTGSYVAAAEELRVSPAAISQHIRKLEDYLGKDMFMRRNNRVLLTDAGRAIFHGTADALQQISDMTQDMTAEKSRSRLVVSSIESVAEKWLLPRLATYARQQPDFRFDLRVEPDPVDFSRHNVDLRLGYGTAHYPDHAIQVLFRDTVLPMCSPAYLQRNPAVLQDGMAAVAGADLLHTTWGPSFGSNPTWPNWFHKAGLPPPDPTGFRLGRSSLALDLAKEGLGVALAQRILAQPDLVRGDLVTLSPLSLDLGHPYCLIHPHGKGRNRALSALVQWLIQSSLAGPVAQASAGTQLGAI